MEGGTRNLNAAQRRRLAIHLAFVERDVHRLRDAIEHPPRDLLLTRYTDPIPVSIVPKLQVATADVQEQVQKIATDLKLSPLDEPVRPAIHSALSREEMELHQLRPSRLRSLGEVEKDDMHYLEAEIRMLRELLAHLHKLLMYGAIDEEDGTP